MNNHVVEYTPDDPISAEIHAKMNRDTLLADKNEDFADFVFSEEFNDNTFDHIIFEYAISVFNSEIIDEDRFNLVYWTLWKGLKEGGQVSIASALRDGRDPFWRNELCTLWDNAKEKMKDAIMDDDITFRLYLDPLHGDYVAVLKKGQFETDENEIQLKKLWFGQRLEAEDIEQKQNIAHIAKGLFSMVKCAHRKKDWRETILAGKDGKIFIEQ